MKKYAKGRDHNRHGFIYFMLMDEPFLVKVGFATDYDKRLADIQTSNPYEITSLGAVPALACDEKHVHQLLKPWRKRGEWYHYEDEVETLVGDLKDYAALYWGEDDYDVGKFLKAYDFRAFQGVW